MSDQISISPVLTDDEWRGLDRGRAVHCIGVDGDQFIGFAHDPDSEGEGVLIDGGTYTASLFEAENVRRLIAIANAALPDDDPRKITRERLQEMRDAADWIGESTSVHAFADALASYLPRELDLGQRDSP